MEKVEDVIFYTLEKTIKTYRQFCQRNLNKLGLDITIDQWLVLKVIEDEKELTQNEIAEKVFKDKASIARIIELLEKKGYLKKKEYNKDKRRSSFKTTAKGTKMLEDVVPVSKNNRKTALKNIDVKDINQMRELLLKILENCNQV